MAQADEIRAAKHVCTFTKPILCTGILLLATLLLLAFMTRDDWKQTAVLTMGCVAVLLILAWFIRGGKITGKAGREGFDFSAETPAIRNENEELPKRP